MFRLKTVFIASASCFTAGGLLGLKINGSEIENTNINDFFRGIWKRTQAPFEFDSTLLRQFPVVEAKSTPISLDKTDTVDHPNGFYPPNRVNEIMRFGSPSVGVDVRNQSDFIVSYDRRTRNPNWVFEHLTADRLATKEQEAANRQNVQFFEDSSIHPYFRATNEDYSRSGYDKGHLAAAGNYRHSQKSMVETFVLSNISPQVGKGFNRDAWNSLEKFVRAIARRNQNVYVCTGPLYLPQRENNKVFVKYEVIGKNHVAVPTHFFKVIVIETMSGDYHLMSFVMPNMVLPENTNLKHFLVPIETIERASGLLLFPHLPKQRIISVNSVN